MKERKFILKIIRHIEREFGVIAYGYKWTNPSKTWNVWNICIDDYEVYGDKRFKAISKVYHIAWRKAFPDNVRMGFAYCKPLEKNLLELAEQDNLILNLN